MSQEQFYHTNVQEEAHNEGTLASMIHMVDKDTYSLDRIIDALQPALNKRGYCISFFTSSEQYAQANQLHSK